MKFLSMILFSVLLFGLSDLGHAASIKKDHFEAGKNITAGNVHPKGAKHLAQLIMDLQDGLPSIVQSITNGDTSHAPSGDAVFDALALKLATSHYVEDSFVATFDQAVGAKTVVVRKNGKAVTLEIPSGTTADGGGAAIASGATDVPAAYRPAATISFPVVVSDNGVLVFGKLQITAAGLLSFTASAAGANFTDDAAAGFDRAAINYSVP